MANEAKAPSPPASTSAQEKKVKHPRWRGLLKVLKGSLYFIPFYNLIPIAIDLGNSIQKYSASRKEKTGRVDALLDTGYSGASATLGAASYLSLYEPLKRTAYLSWLPGIGNVLSGLRDIIAPRDYTK